MAEALDKAQQRHPNLSIRIVMDAYSRPVFKHAAWIPIPLWVLEVDQEHRWEQEVEKELATRFKTEKEALVWAVLVQRPNNTELILIGHHATADSTSMTYLFRDILAAISRQKLEPMQPQKTNDETLGLPKDQDVVGSERTRPLVKVKKSFVPKISSLRFSAENTRDIINRSKEEQTTVHGALCAAVLIACRNMRKGWADKK
ncbi:condensation domain-containing protein [Sinomicrobium sp. M5D2P9]